MIVQEMVEEGAVAPSLVHFYSSEQANQLCRAAPAVLVVEDSRNGVHPLPWWVRVLIADVDAEWNYFALGKANAKGVAVVFE